jgi:hypothetical protein
MITTNKNLFLILLSFFLPIAAQAQFNAPFDTFFTT